MIRRITISGLALSALILAGAGCIGAGNGSPQVSPVNDSGTQVFGSMNSPAETPPLVGGDRDVHGCIGSAGYSWCPKKEKCLRIWEESCYADPAEEISYLLAAKYDKRPEDVKFTISKQDDTHLSGSVKYGSGEGPGGGVLAAKVDNVWQVVYDGNGSVDCAALRQQYGFTDDILVPNYCDKISEASGECTCPSGYVKDGDACNPQCYYSKPPCLAPSLVCTPNSQK